MVLMIFKTDYYHHFGGTALTFNKNPSTITLNKQLKRMM